MAVAFMPRSPSPNSVQPNAGPRSQVTHFISTDSEAGSSRPWHQKTHSTGRFSLAAEAPSGRRAIAHSPKVLGRGQEVEEELALEELRNGEVDVSFPGPEASSYEGELAYSPRKKGKARLFDAGEDADFPNADELADVDLERGAEPSRPLASSSRANLLSGLGIREDDSYNLGYGGNSYHFDTGGGLGKSRYYREYGSSNGRFGAPEGFERIMPRECAWMWISVVLTLSLCLVATLISTDVIDWPGDGIGKQ